MHPVEFCRTIAEELNVKKVSFMVGKADDKPIEICFTSIDGCIDIYLSGERCFKEDLAIAMLKTMVQSISTRMNEPF